MATEIIAGLFALLAVYLAWRLGESSSKQSLKREQWKEKSSLYAEIYSVFEQAMSEIINHQERDCIQKFHALNSRVALLAKEEISEKYFTCCRQLEEWSVTYVKAYPNNGFIQSPDPTAKFKQPAADQFEALRSSIKELAALMKIDLAGT